MSDGNASAHDQLFAAFGSNRVPVSRLGFGGAVAGLTNYLGQYDAAAPENRARVIAAIHRARALGVTYFDTAPGYGNGLSETLYGEALAGAKIFLATKVQLRFAGKVRQSLEASLRRLQRDKVDLLQIHGTSYGATEEAVILRPGGMLDELRELKDEGLIGQIGFTSEDNNAAVYRFIESGGFDVIQLCYNFINQHPFEPSRPFGSMLEAKKRGMSVVTMRSATSGVVQRWIDLVNPENRFDYTAALIQFVLSNRLVDVALVGMRDPEIVESTVRIWQDRAGRIDIPDLHTRYVTSAATP